MDYGRARAIPEAPVRCPADMFENAIREFGVEFCCEWFGHDADGDFTKETIRVLCDRSGIEI